MPYKDLAKLRQWQIKYRERKRFLARIWYAKHAEQERIRDRARYAANAEKQRLRSARFRKEHLSELREKARAYAKKHPKRSHGGNYRRWRAEHLEQERARDRARYRNDPEPSKARAAVRRARKRGVKTERFSWLEIFMRDGGRCQLCGARTPRRLRGTREPNAPEIDHLVPIARGGPHLRVNVQLACRKCNGTKNARIRGQLRMFG